MAAINRLSRGLLQLLDSQNQGVNPASLGEEIVPVLDLDRFIHLAIGLSQLQITSLNVSGSQDLPSNVVPAGRVWWLKSGNVTISLNAPRTNAPLVYGIPSARILRGGINDWIAMTQNQSGNNPDDGNNALFRNVGSFRFDEDSLLPMIPGNIYIPSVEYLSPRPTSDATVVSTFWFYDLPY